MVTNENLKLMQRTIKLIHERGGNLSENDLTKEFSEDPQKILYILEQSEKKRVIEKDISTWKLTQKGREHIYEEKDFSQSYLPRSRQKSSWMG